MKPKELYALVYEGKPYIATAYGYYTLEKSGNDFFFTGKAKVTANSSDVIAASILFGVVGGMIATNASGIYEMQIDHVNGEFIPIRAVSEAESGAF